MLLENYSIEMGKVACRTDSRTMHCIARFDTDISAALPYLNAELGGFLFSKDDPVSVTFRGNGQLITVHPDYIAINALHNVEEARKILEWIKGEINKAWKNRDSITPSYEAAPRPQIYTILKSLPKSNCGNCGLPTCMVFASLAVEGGKGVDDCPELSQEQKKGLEDYLGQFRFDW